MSDKHYEDMANIKIPEQMRQAALDAAGQTVKGVPWQEIAESQPTEPAPSAPSSQWRIWTKTGDKVLLQAPGEVIVRRLEGMIEFARTEDLILLPERHGDEPVEPEVLFGYEWSSETGGKPEFGVCSICGADGKRLAIPMAHCGPGGRLMPGHTEPSGAEPEGVADLLYDETFKDAWRGVNDAIKEAYRRGQLSPIPK